MTGYKLECLGCGVVGRMRDVCGCDPMPYHYCHCAKHFSFCTGTVMESNRHTVHKWLIAASRMLYSYTRVSRST